MARGRRVGDKSDSKFGLSVLFVVGLLYHGLLGGFLRAFFEKNLHNQARLGPFSHKPLVKMGYSENRPNPYQINIRTPKCPEIGVFLDFSPNLLKKGY